MSAVEAFWGIITDLAGSLTPWVVIDPDTAGVLIRLGKYKRTLTGGIHFKIPFVDSTQVVSCVFTTQDLPTQSLVTADNRGIIVGGIVAYSISDPKRYLLEVYQASDVIKDVALGAIKNEVMAYDYDDLRESISAVEDEITKLLSNRLIKFGIKVSEDGFNFSDMAPARNFRLLQDYNYRSTNTNDSDE